MLRHSDLDEIRQNVSYGDNIDLLCDVIEELRDTVDEQASIIRELQSKIDHIIVDIVDLESQTYDD